MICSWTPQIDPDSSGLILEHFSPIQCFRYLSVEYKATAKTIKEISKDNQRKLAKKISKLMNKMWLNFQDLANKNSL